MKHRLKFIFTLIGISMLSACGNGEGQKTVDMSDFERISQAASKAEDRVTVQQLAEWIVESRQDYQLIDIRDSKSYQDSHLKGAESLPLSVLTAAAGLENLSDSKKIIVYSNGSENAAKAVVMLRLLGLDSYLLSGGYNAWQQQVLNPDIPVQAVDDEAPQVALQRAIACHFKGATVQAPAVTAKPVKKASPAFTPPVFTPPVAPAGLIIDEGC
ncbi:MAG: rhodanese-like domain-containing protein [Pseudomonadota bacterium]|nr:rhodanese-like domain-containing protein [Pseudomonadota bacterium]